MNRKCIIVGNPGVKGDENYCQGVLLDIENYINYLKSAVGGAWDTNEILPPMICPQASQLDAQLQALKSSDYLFFIFCGHGFYSTIEHATIIELSKDKYYNSDKIRATTDTKSVILDCCRKPYPILVQDHAIVEGSMLTFSSTLSRLECRKKYDEAIAECAGQSLYAFGCNIGEEAGDDPIKGGYYSYALINKGRAVSNYCHNTTLSLVKCHNDAVIDVLRISGRKQSPYIEKPRTSFGYLPFAVSY